MYSLSLFTGWLFLPIGLGCLCFHHCLHCVSVDYCLEHPDPPFREPLNLFVPFLAFVWPFFPLILGFICFLVLCLCGREFVSTCAWSKDLFCNMFLNLLYNICRLLHDSLTLNGCALYGIVIISVFLSLLHCDWSEASSSRPQYIRWHQGDQFSWIVNFSIYPLKLRIHWCFSLLHFLNFWLLSFISLLCYSVSICYSCLPCILSASFSCCPLSITPSLSSFKFLPPFLFTFLIISFLF